MTVFRDGQEATPTNDEAIRRAIEQSGTDVVEKLGKLIAGMPRDQVVRIMGEPAGGDDKDDADSLRAIAKRLGASKGDDSANFVELGKEQNVAANSNAEETIRLLEQMED